VLGEDHRHLDFRFSMVSVPQPGNDRLRTTTVVRAGNRLGHVCRRVIRLFHHLIVQAILARLAAQPNLP
jgi:hypothetical protein